jgi:uncharacterized membrane protein YdjX (TVP38/TMEM64 family)
MSRAGRVALGVLGLAALGAAAASLVAGGMLHTMTDGEALRAKIEDLGAFGAVAVVLLIAGAIVFSPIPSAPIGVAAGAAFGQLWGSVYVVLGSLLGALIAFGIARRFGYHAARRLSWAARLLDGTDSQWTLAGIVFASRLVPFISFDAISYAAGLTPLRPWWFGVATVAGVVPISFAIAWSGDHLVASESGWLGTAVLLLGGITLLPVAWQFLRRRRAPKPGPPDA